MCILKEVEGHACVEEGTERNLNVKQSLEIFCVSVDIFRLLLHSLYDTQQPGLRQDEPSSLKLRLCLLHWYEEPEPSSTAFPRALSGS